MMKKTFSKHFILTVLLIVAVLFSYSKEIPPLKNRVNDQIGLLTQSQLNVLDSKLKTLEDSTGAQLVVLIISTTEPETIEQYGIEVAEKWQVGREKIDDGVILIIAKDDRKVRIEVGYGLEGAIPDAYSKRIIEQIIVPDFRSGNFYHGIDLAVDAISGLIRGENLPQSINKKADKNFKMGPFVIIVLFIFILIGKFIKSKLGKPAAAIAIVLISLIALFLVPVLIAIFIGFFLLIAIFGRSGGGIGGGYYGGGGFGSSGGGGFSGGGGSFGGGGSSGSW